VSVQGHHYFGKFSALDAFDVVACRRGSTTQVGSERRRHERQAHGHGESRGSRGGRDRQALFAADPLPRSARGLPAPQRRAEFGPRARPHDNEVAYTDKHIGRLLDYIAAQPWRRAPRSS